MPKPLGSLAFAGIAALVAFPFAPSTLDDTVKALQGTPTLQVEYTVRTVDGVSDAYSVLFKKPNLLRIETPTQRFVSDGKDLTTLDKATGVYYKQPTTPTAIATVLAPDALNPWAPFFDPKALSPVASKGLGTRDFGGQTLDAVQATFGPAGARVVTYFLSPSDKVARRVQIDLTKPSGRTTLIESMKDVRLGGEIGAETFAFKAPEGGRQTTLEDIEATRWRTNLDEAKEVAAKRDQRVLVEFVTTWSEGSKKLDADALQTERFKDLVKGKAVLVRVDVEAQPSVARTYGIDTVPAVMVLEPGGTVVARMAGYDGADDFYAFLKANLG